MCYYKKGIKKGFIMKPDNTHHVYPDKAGGLSKTFI